MIKRTTEDYNNLVVYMADGSKPRYAIVEKSKAVACGIGGLIIAGVMAGGVPNQDHLLFVNASRIGFPTIILAYSSIKGIIAKKIYY